jgi:hypothetical protein
MTKTIENLFIYSATYTALLPVILFFLLLHRTAKSRLIIIIITYSFCEFTTNIISFYLRDLDVLKLYAIFTIIEYLLFALYFYFVINNKAIKKLIIFSSGCFIFFSIIYALTIQNKTLDTVPIGIETLLILTFSFYYLYEQMEESSQILIYHRFSFWIVAGIMIYLGGSLFIYLYANEVDQQTRHEYWIFQNAFTIIKNLFFTISQIVFIREVKNSSLQKKYSF